MTGELTNMCEFGKPHIKTRHIGSNTCDNCKPMNQNPNTNKEECACGNPESHKLYENDMCPVVKLSTPSPKDWEDSFMRKFKIIEVVKEDEADGVFLLETDRNNVKDFIRNEKAKSEKISDETKEFYYQNGWREGQKELAKKVMDMNATEYKDQGDVFIALNELFSSKHLLD